MFVSISFNFPPWSFIQQLTRDDLASSLILQTERFTRQIYVYEMI